MRLKHYNISYVISNEHSEEKSYTMCTIRDAYRLRFLPRSSDRNDIGVFGRNNTTPATYQKGAFIFTFLYIKTYLYIEPY